MAKEIHFQVGPLFVFFEAKTRTCMTQGGKKKLGLCLSSRRLSPALQPPETLADIEMIMFLCGSPDVHLMMKKKGPGECVYELFLSSCSPPLFPLDFSSS